MADKVHSGKFSHSVELLAVSDVRRSIVRPREPGKLIISAAGLHDTHATSWKVEVHDRSWPASKTLAYEVKKLENEKNWNKLRLDFRPYVPGASVGPASLPPVFPCVLTGQRHGSHCAGRVLVWRAQCITKNETEPWTEWCLVDMDAHYARECRKADEEWDLIFERAAKA